jgi:sugar (pentulose or hexulose) kinase
MILLLDIGASRIKACSIENNAVIDSLSVPSPSLNNHSRQSGHYTIPAELYRTAIHELLNKLYNHQVTGVYVCTEMHGVLVDNTYISWKDSRAKINKQQAQKFLEITGMQLRPGIAYASLEHDKIQNTVIGTLLDTFLDGPAENTNISLAASLGLVNKHTQQYSHDLLHNKISAISVNTKLPIGTVTIHGQCLPVYGGIGDLQSALLGSQLGQLVDAVINLGTGSQVVCTTDSIENYEIRPMPDGSYVKVITHIPCGRALSILAEKFGEKRFWRAWQSLEPLQILTTDPNQAQLSFFESAWQYSAESGYVKFKENQSFEELVAGIAHSWSLQYVRALNMLDTNFEKQRVALSGGLSHRSPFLIPVLTAYTNRKFVYCDTVTGEETLDGLLRLQ